ncbi:hypothetical protein BDV93DRAFT_94937 [Ceratobasidium sp. AG-I]|nr:hypothetical protein BDV93DRAFT_94937 [Ceratobasidium sp. AG-I]
MDEQRVVRNTRALSQKEIVGNEVGLGKCVRPSPGDGSVGSAAFLASSVEVRREVCAQTRKREVKCMSCMMGVSSNRSSYKHKCPASESDHGAVGRSVENGRPVGAERPTDSTEHDRGGGEAGTTENNRLALGRATRAAQRWKEERRMGAYKLSCVRGVVCVCVCACATCVAS